MSGDELARKPGHSKLVYDKAKRTIVTIDPNPSPAGQVDERVRDLTAEIWREAIRLRGVNSGPDDVFDRARHALRKF